MTNSITQFWFDSCTWSDWFKKDDEFDEIIKSQYLEHIELALAGKLNSWTETSAGFLALILLLDQFPRNVFRGTPRAYSGDEKALKLCFAAQEEGLLSYLGNSQRLFLLMPMMHSEDIDVQTASIPLFRQYANGPSLIAALQHQEIISRFGRFPHRNDVLGRVSTQEEIEFLKEPGSSF